MARPNNPQAKAALVEAALELFGSKGLLKTRVEDITSRCRLSKGAFYLHFTSKEALFSQQVDLLMKEVEQVSRRRRSLYRTFLEAAKVNSQSALDWNARLVEHDRKFDIETLEVLWKRRAVVDVVYHGAQGTPFENVVWTFIDAETKRVCQELKQMRKLKLCRDDLPDEIVAAQSIGGWLLLSRRMARLKQRPDIEGWVKALSSMLYQGISNLGLNPL